MVLVALVDDLWKEQDEDSASVIVVFSTNNHVIILGWLWELRFGDTLLHWFNYFIQDRPQSVDREREVQLMAASLWRIAGLVLSLLLFKSTFNHWVRSFNTMGCSTINMLMIPNCTSLFLVIQVML